MTGTTAPPPADYSHDVFISYRRGPFYDAWLTEHFLPVFLPLLENSIAAYALRAPQGIFFDRANLAPERLKFDVSGIEPGAVWQDELRSAIRTSRCVVALWQPMYFYSNWCQVEWRSFHDRSVQTNRRLVVPISLHDGASFPADAQALQFADFSQFALIGAAFRRTRRFVQFQVELARLADDVGKVVAAAPAFQLWSVANALAVAPAPHVSQSRL